MKTSVRKAGGGYVTTRAQYKAAKKYDHAQFDGFCSTIFSAAILPSPGYGSSCSTNTTNRSNSDFSTR